MFRSQAKLQSARVRHLHVPLLCAAQALVGCAARHGSLVGDTSVRITPASGREGSSANDVFMRKPWEIWRGPHGIGRYHRDVSMVFTDEVESFKISDIAVYADDGSDVRFEYTATDLGESSQSRESISAFVYRAKDVLDQEWDVVSRRALQEKTGAKETQPFPLPTYYPRTSREMAMIVPAGAGDPGSTFFQVILFHQSGWAVRIEISCPANDVASAQRNTLVFLREIRVRG